MRILFFINSLVGGGAERVLVNLADEFIKNDQEAFEAGHVLNMGQWLSIPFILLGLFLIIRAYKRPLSPVVDKQPESLEPKYRKQNDKK